MSDFFDLPDDWKIAGHDQAVNPPTPNKGLIITGLGGKGKLFRYFVVISVKPGVKLKPNLQKIVNKKFTALFPANKAELEKIKLKPDHLELLILINMDIAVEKIIMSLISAINQFKPVLHENYLVVNNRVLTSAEIRRYLKEPSLAVVKSWMEKQK